jgi:hypothetical protein
MFFVAKTDNSGTLDEDTMKLRLSKCGKGPNK